jgi:hypothetical protein
MVAPVIPNIVGIRRELQDKERLQRVAAEHPARAIATIGYQDPLPFGQVEDALGLIQSPDAANQAAFAQVQDFDAVVTQGNNEEAFACKIDRHMIDSVLDSGEGDGLD